MILDYVDDMERTMLENDNNEEYIKERMRDMLISLKEWNRTDYEFGLEILGSDSESIGDALDIFYWQSDRIVKDARKALNMIHDIVSKEKLLDHNITYIDKSEYTEGNITDEVSNLLKYIKTKDVKYKKKEWSISYYELAFLTLSSDLKTIDILDKTSKTEEDIWRTLGIIKEILSQNRYIN